MIGSILTVPRIQVVHWIKNGITPFHSWALISIHSSGGILESDLKKLDSLGCKEVLTERFCDVSNKQHALAVGMVNDKGDPLVFDSLMAKRVIEFIDRMNKEEIDCLVINCAAGVSRSGAIGLFACRYLKLDENIFREDNPHLSPNTLVTDLLNKESGLNDEYIKSWKVWKRAKFGEVDINNIF